MTQELVELGGGDARVGKALVCCFVGPGLAPEHCQTIVKADAEGITVADPRSTASITNSKMFSVPCYLRRHASGSLLQGTLGQVQTYIWICAVYFLSSSNPLI